MKLRLAIMILTACTIASKAQITFKGGNDALIQYLGSHIIYPEYSRQNCIAATIQVSFRLDTKGNVNNVSVQKGLGIDLDDEAVRVVKTTSGHWIVNKDYNTNSTVVLPIRFDPDRTRCGTITNASMSAAIANYRAQEALQNAVTNYYKNKYTGKADTTNEAQIIALKKQLGYNDEFITDLLDQADRKLKQGDKSGACDDWNFIRNIGSDKADTFIERYCK
jgi:TonB family protein